MSRTLRREDLENVAKGFEATIGAMKVALEELEARIEALEAKPARVAVND